MWSLESSTITYSEENKKRLCGDSPFTSTIKIIGVELIAPLNKITIINMRDQNISLPRIMELHPKLRQEVIDLIDKVETGFSKAIALRVVQGYRTIEEQDRLYAQGRTAKGPKVTNAKGGSSFHNFGLAIDFALLYDKDGNGTFETLSWDIAKDGDADGKKDWQEVIDVFKAAGWSWGGEWHSLKDYPHLEKSFGLSLKELRRRYDAKLFTDGYVNL